MKRPLLQEISYKSGKFLLVQKFREKYFDVYWHFHPEIEMTYIIKGEGKRYVGDNIEEYQQGDLVMVGSNLPHCWISAPDYFSDNKLYTEALVLHFRSAVIVDDSIDLPDFYYIRKALLKCKQGISIKGKTKNDIVAMMQKMAKAKSIKRYIILLEILDLIGRTSDLTELSGKAYSPSLMEHDDEKIRFVYSYVGQNYKKQITIADLAKKMNMNPSSLCRYFKEKTKSNIVRFINEYRISNVCKLIINNSLTIQQAAYECGFNNIANFNRQFKKVMTISPLNYIKKYKKVME